MTRSDLFKAAHAEAKKIRSFFACYRDAFAFALRELYAAKPAEKTTAERLEELGAQPWAMGTMVRYYIDDALLPAVFGLEIDRYKSGSIASACLGGVGISNSMAYRLLGQKIFFDATEGRWHQKRDGRTCDLCETLAAALRV